MTERLPLPYQLDKAKQGPQVSRRWLLTRVPRDAALSAVRPTPGTIALVDSIAAVARNPQLAEKALDLAKKHWDAFRNSPQLMAPGVNIGIAQRLAANTYILDVCSETGITAASVQGRADLMIDTLKSLIKEEPDQSYFLADVYAALGDFKNFDRLVRAPEVPQYDNALWADTVIAGAKAKHAKGLNPDSDIEYAMKLLAGHCDPQSVLPQLKAAEAVHDILGDRDSKYMKRVKEMLDTKEEGEVHKRNKEAAFSLFVRTDPNAAAALLPDLEATGLFGWIKPASFLHWRRDLIEGLINVADRGAAQKLVEGAMEAVDKYVRDYKLTKIPGWMLQDVTRIRAMAQVISFQNDGPADFTATTDDILNRNFEHGTTAHLAKPLLEWVLDTGGSGLEFIGKVSDKVHKSVEGTLEYTWDRGTDGGHKDPDDYQTATALDGLIEMRLMIGDARGAHSDYAELVKINKKYDGEFGEYEAKSLAAIAKTEHELLRGDYVADIR